MLITNPIVDLTKKPVQEFRPITDLDGNIIDDLCVTDQCKLYKYSEVLSKDTFSECEEVTDKYVRFSKSNPDRKTINIHPFVSKNDESYRPHRTNPFARVIKYAFDEEKHSADFYKEHEVDHINPSRPLNDRPSNLRWVTPAENMYYAGETGVMLKKFSKETINEICQMIVDGKSRCEIYTELNVPPFIVDDVHAGRAHKSVSKNYIDQGFTYSNKHKKPKEEGIAEAHEICKMLENGASNSEVCKTLGVQSGLVTSICKGQSYKYVSCNYNLENRTVKEFFKTKKSEE